MNNPEASIGYANLDRVRVQHDCEQFIRRRNRWKFRELRNAIKSEMAIKRTRPRKWFRKQPPIQWTRAEAVEYLRDTDIYSFHIRWKKLVLSGWGTLADCEKLLSVARSENIHTMLVDIDLWDRICTHFK